MQSFQDDFLDSSVSCECATDGNLGEEEARRAMGSATFFLLFFPVAWQEERTIGQCGSFQACRCGSAVYVCIFRPGRNQDHDKDQ